MKSKQLALFGPVSWDFEREAYQLLCGELGPGLAADDGGDNVGSQQGQTQQAGNVTRRNALLAGDGVQGQVSALHQACVDIVCRAMILSRPGWLTLVVGVLHQHSHLAADALEACFYLQR
jgi:hypothetical protein